MINHENKNKNQISFKEFRNYGSLEEDKNLWYDKFCLEPSCPSGRRGQSAIVKRLIALSAKT